MNLAFVLLALLVTGCASSPSRYRADYAPLGYTGIASWHADIGVISRLGRLKRVTLERVTRDSPAWLAGLSSEDEVIAIDGRKVRELTWEGFQDLLGTLAHRKPGETIVLEVTSPPAKDSRRVEVLVSEKPQTPNQSLQPTGASARG